MDNDAARQTKQFVIPNTPVILNIGLLGPRYAKPQGLSEGTILGRASVALRNIMHPLKGEVDTGNDEPTLIVHGVFNALAAQSTILYDMVERCDQDAISLWYPEFSIGYLFGPHADKWDPFNSETFKLPMILRPIHAKVH